MNLPGLAFRDLHSADPGVSARFEKSRMKQGKDFSEVETSEILMATAPHVSNFVAKIFGVEDRCKEIRLPTDREQVILKSKKEFFVRRVLKKFTPEFAARLDGALLDQQTTLLRTTFAGIPREDLVASSYRFSESCARV